MKGPLRIAVLVAAAALLLAASAPAEEAVPTREEYFSQVEPICEANTIANKRILANVRERARSRDARTVRQAGGQFIRASEAFGSTLGKISSVPRPPADDARLVKWFGYLRIVKTNLRKLGVALQEGDKIKAAHEQIRVERSSNAANNVSFVFEFRYCRLTPSRFT